MNSDSYEESKDTNSAPRSSQENSVASANHRIELRNRRFSSSNPLFMLFRRQSSGDNSVGQQQPGVDLNDSFQRNTLFGENNAPFKYPGSIQEAKLHEEANILGTNEIHNHSDSSNVEQLLESEVEEIRECPCCGNTVKSQKLRFFNFDYKAISDNFGDSLPYLFTINKLFITSISVLVVLYLIYFQIQVESLCAQHLTPPDPPGNNHSVMSENYIFNQTTVLPDIQKQQPMQSHKCQSLFKMSIMSEVELRRESPLDVQTTLADLKFGLLIALQVINILFFQSSNFLKGSNNTKSTNSGVGKKMNKLMPSSENKLKLLRKRTLLIKHLPQFYTYEQIEKNIQLLVKNTYNLPMRVYCVTHFYDFYERNKLAEQRMELLQKYYQTKSSKTNKSSKTMLIAEKLQRNYTLLQQLSKEQPRYCGSVLITFESQKDAHIVLNLFKKSYFLSIVHSLKLALGITAESTTTRRMTCQKAPQINELVWQNIGKFPQKGKLLTLLVLFTIFIFIGLPRLTEILYDAQFTANSQKYSFHNKALDYGISVLLFVISNCVWMGMKYLLRLSKLSTSFYESIYMVISNFAFHMQYYIIVPIFLTYFSQKFDANIVNYDSINTRLYGIATMISGFSALSLVEIFFGPRSIRHIFRKWNIQRKNKKYFQEILNKKFQRPGFPIEKRILILYKQYTFGIVVSFIVPLAWVFVLLGLIFHFIGNRFSLIKQYSLYSYYNTKIVSFATRIASLALMYVVTISYLLTEQYSGFFTREIYIILAKYMLVFNVLGNTIVERVYQAMRQKRKTISILKEQIKRRDSVFTKAPVQQDQIFSYYHNYLKFQATIHPSWSNGQVEQIINSQAL